MLAVSESVMNSVRPSAAKALLMSVRPAQLTMREQGSAERLNSVLPACADARALVTSETACPHRGQLRMQDARNQKDLTGC